MRASENVPVWRVRHSRPGRPSCQGIRGAFELTGAQSGWTWGIGHSHYLMMILGLSATLGVFLLIASRNPAAHRSLIWFTVWSSVVHAVIMAVQFTPRGRAMA
jgi:hypothetical protein